MYLRITFLFFYVKSLNMLLLIEFYAKRVHKKITPLYRILCEKSTLTHLSLLYIEFSAKRVHSYNHNSFLLNSLRKEYTPTTRTLLYWMLCERSTLIQPELFSIEFSVKGDILFAKSGKKGLPRYRYPVTVVRVSISVQSDKKKG
jgi:hypothetical protein